jgi:hypothetical protein
MVDQENCVTIVNNVIEKIKEISQKVIHSDNDNIDVLGNAVYTLMNDHETALHGKGTENVELKSEINSLKTQLEDETKRANNCATELEKLKAENLAAQKAAEEKMKQMRNKAEAAVTEKNEALIAAKEASENATKANEEATKALAEAEANRLKAENLAAQKEEALKKSSLSEREKKAAEEEAKKARANTIQANSAATAAIEAAQQTAKAEALAKEGKYSITLEALTKEKKSLEDLLETSNNLNRLKDDQISVQNTELSSKDDELIAMKKKYLELMKQYYGKHLAFKEIFTELNKKINDNTQKVEGEGEVEGKVNSLNTISDFELITNNIKQRIVDKQEGVDVEYFTNKLNSLKDIKERINAINKRIQVLKEAKTSEPQTKEATAGGGDNQGELNKINSISEISELQKLLKNNEDEFIKLNNDNNLLKPDESDQSDQSAQRENLNELTKQHWNSKDDYDDITTFANTLIKMYNDSVGQLNVSIAENKTLNERIKGVTESGKATATEQSISIKNLTRQLEKSESDIKDLNFKISGVEANFAAILDNFKVNITTLLNNLKDYDPITKKEIPTIEEGKDYNGIMAQIYNSLLANNENLYTSEDKEMSILSNVNESDGVLIKLYKEKLNLKNILDMIKKKFEDYKDNNNESENANLGYLEKFNKFKEEKTNYSYKEYNLQAAKIASTKPIITDNEKIIPVNDFFEDVVSSFETNNNEMVEMKTKVENFLKTKTSESETISELKTSVGRLESNNEVNENKINSHFGKFKNLKENFMKFKKYIDSNNLKISSLLKEKIDAIHNKTQDAKTIFSKDQHKLLAEYTESSEEINNQIEKETKEIISRFLTNSFKEQYNEGESGGSSDNKTTSRNIDLVLEEFSTTSSTSGGYSKNKVKMDTNSIKKRKRSIKKYK